jgi:indolepyruvate decarboxylase
VTVTAERAAHNSTREIMTMTVGDFLLRRMLAEPPSDPERLRSCTAAIASRLSDAKSPAILVDLDADRFGAAGEIMRLAEKTQLPVAVAPTAKAVIDETFPHYLGLYNGKASQPHVQEAIENSDCLLSIGYRPIDLTTGDFTGSLPADTIHVRGHSVDVGEDNYQAVTLAELLRGVTDAVPQVTNRATRHFAAAAAAAAAGNHADGSPKLTQAAYWQAIQGYIRSGDVLVAEDGTSYASAGLQLPPNCSFISQVIWGSIGYSVGSLLGTLTAAPDRRHLLFVGDGSFQLTAQEVSTMLRHDYKPVIFLINNRGYTIERCWLGKTSRFNDVANWAYADLPKVFRPDTTARSFVVKTVADLEEALSAPNDSLIFIESIMDPFDAPTAVINSGNNGADIDYGPRGPQHRGNMLLRPAT